MKGGSNAMAKRISLPEPRTTSEVSVEEAINNRRSTRQFKEEDLSLKEISQLLFAGQGITNKYPAFRAAPSAGATYPLELFVATKDGIYRYIPKGHKLEQIEEKDIRTDLAKAALGQASISEAPVNIIICAEYKRTSKRYGERATRYVHIEAGHVAENILLQAVALTLGGVPIGAFYDDKVKLVLDLPEELDPLYIIPIGHAK